MRDGCWCWTGRDGCWTALLDIELHHVATLWATMGCMGPLQVYEDSNIDGGGTGATEVTGATSGDEDESGTAGTTH